MTLKPKQKNKQPNTRKKTHGNQGEKTRDTIATPPLAIVGIGCLFPKADDLTAYWSNIRRGVDGIGPIPENSHWKPSDYFDKDPASPDMTYANRGGFINPVDFNALDFGISPKNIEATDTTQLLGMLVAKQALRDANYETGKGVGDGRAFDRDRTSVILGVTGTLELVVSLGARLGHPIWRKALDQAGVDQETADDVVQRISDQYVPWQENSFPGLLGNVAAGRIANRFDTGGTNCVVDAACASSLSAIHMAAMELYTGRSDMAITGGLDTFNDIFMYMCFSKTPALSPTGDCRPFSDQADGTILGEGLGVVVLKRLDDAIRDQDKIYAVLKGIGASSDGRGNAIYAPSSKGQVKALKNAYQNANVTPDTIELIESHGTGTKVGDAIELESLTEVYKQTDGQEPWCAIGSVKSMIGHTKAAAGVAGLIKTAMALHHRVLPPTIKVDRPAPLIKAGNSPVYVNTQPRPWLSTKGHPRRAALSAFGFGGSNFHCVLEESPQAKPEIDWDASVLLFTFSASTATALSEQLERLDQPRAWDKWRQLARQTVLDFDRSRPCKVTLVVEREVTDLAKLVAGAKKMLAKTQVGQTWQTPDGAFGSHDVQSSKLAMLFPGQGAQYVGMLRDLSCQFPMMLETITQANDAFGQVKYGARLSDKIYPVPAFEQQAKIEQSLALQKTDVAQPALGAVSLGAYRVLEHLGVHTNAMAGHSFGELTALYASGCLSDLHTVAVKRGNIMAKLAGGGNGMIALLETPEKAAQLIEENKLDLTIANFNAPQQTVVSGDLQSIDQLKAICKSQNIRCKKLDVAAAFHSKYVANASPMFETFLTQLAFTDTDIKVYANSTGEPYPKDEKSSRKLLAGQLAKSVKWVDLINRMYADGCRTFIEVGPSKILTSLVKQILADKPHHAIALDSSVGKRSGMCDLSLLIAQLVTLGIDIDLAKWDETCPMQDLDQGKPAVNVTLSGANVYTPPTRPAKPSRPRVQPNYASLPPTSTASPPLSTSQSSPPLSSTSPSNLSITPSANMENMQTPNQPYAAQMLQTTQQSILALQKMQEQTAQLHRQYLQGQQSAQSAIEQLIRQQQQMINMPMAPAPAPVSPPAFAPATQSVAPISSSPLSPVASPIVTPTPAATASPDVTQSAAPVAASNTSSTLFEQALLSVVSEKTGYPAEMLELDMSMDADLGIDSIKRVEILSALQDRLPNLPAIKPDELGQLQTLSQIVDYMLASSPAATASPDVTQSAAPVAASNTSSTLFEQALLSVVSEKTGYPAEMLELDMSMDADLGIDSIKRVEILSALQDRLPNLPAIKPDELGQLQTLSQIVDYMLASSPAATASIKKKVECAAPCVAKALDSTQSLSVDRQVLCAKLLNSSQRRSRVGWPTSGEIWITDDKQGLAKQLAASLAEQGVSHRIVALSHRDAKTRVAGLIILPSEAITDAFIFEAFSMLQHIGSRLCRVENAILAAVCHLDGTFGLTATRLREPLTASLAGMVKTASHEWENVHCKVFDVADLQMPNLASQLVDELTLGGSIEIGLVGDDRYQLQLERQQLNGQVENFPLQKNDLMIVTGGARGVTAEVAIAIAHVCQPSILLLGRSDLPKDEASWLVGLDGELEIKKALMAHLEKPVTPKKVQAAYEKILANQEVLKNIQRLKQAGAKVLYRSVDVRDSQQVLAIVDEARKQFGPVRGVVHGAGVLADRLIIDKTIEQFKQVYSTKIDGLRSLLKAIGHDDLKAMVLFSSSTGRFGRKGQVDYAAANEVLNKMAQVQTRLRPNCRVLSINWGPWDGGMVTPQLKALFASEGVSVIPLQAGADYLVKELATATDDPVEMVILGPSQNLAQSFLESDEKTSDDLHLAFEVSLNLEQLSFMESHVIGGKAVLPAAMMIEWLAHGAMKDNPGLSFLGLNDFQVFKGVQLELDQTLCIQIFASAPVVDGPNEWVTMELRSSSYLHARTRILLGATRASAPTKLPLPTGQYDANAENVYIDDRLFHGPALQAIKKVIASDSNSFACDVKPSPMPATWMNRPMRSSWIVSPFAIDAAFQAMILWAFEHHQMGSLPTGISSLRLYGNGLPKTATQLIAKVTDTSSHAGKADIQWLNAKGQVVAQIIGYQMVMDTSLAQTFLQNKLEAAV